MKVKILIILVILFCNTLFSNEWNIYIDADYTGAKESSESIEKGIKLALKKYLPKDISINIISLDHRGNSRRSRAHIEEFSNDPNALAMFCGLHSPPVLANLSLINQNRVILLDPWAAATPITRTPDENGDNWVFRLSIDDSQAGEVIVAYSIDIEKYIRPIIILEDTGWGKANEKTIINALKSRGIDSPKILWFDWKVGNLGIKKIISDVIEYKSDVILLVANYSEGANILKEISQINNKIPVRSHWGITGRDLFNDLHNELKNHNLDLKFIQTSFLFTNNNLTNYQLEVWNDIKQSYTDIKEYKDLKAPLGFIHSYDLTKILIEALKKIGSSNDIILTRNQLRLALESSNTQVNGLIKIYKHPFSSYNSESFFAHEALRIKDFKMANYNSKGEIVISDGF